MDKMTNEEMDKILKETYSFIYSVTERANTLVSVCPVKYDYKDKMVKNIKRVIDNLR
jgi:hypothetical protein